MRLVVIISLTLPLFCSCNNDNKVTKKKIGNHFVEASFINDSIIDGIARYYNLSDNLSKKVMFKNGKREGAAIGYYPNGKIKDSSNFTNGLLNGYAFAYDKSGYLIMSNFFYYGILMGPHYLYDSQKLTEYSFTDFDKNTLVYTKYDSTGKCIQYEYKAKPILTQRLDDKRNPVLGVFFYFLMPAKFNCAYTMGFTNDMEETKNEVKINSNRIFIDTILPYPEKDWSYFLSTHLENIKDSINKVYMDVLKERE